jgi:hypothetical protein
MPTCRGVFEAFEGLPEAGKLISQAGDVIRVTRYRRHPSQPSLFQRRALPALSRRAPSVGRGHQQTPWMEAGDPTGPPKSDPGAACGPLG